VWSASGTLVFSDIPPARCTSSTRRLTGSPATANRATRPTATPTTSGPPDHVRARHQPGRARGGGRVDHRLASEYAGAELNSPNDVVVDKAGGIWFTDPPYGGWTSRRCRAVFPPTGAGLYRLGPDDGPITLLADDFECPNGLCFADDERTLFVDDSPVCTSVASRSEATCCPATKSGSPGRDLGSARGRRRRRARRDEGRQRGQRVLLRSRWCARVQPPGTVPGRGAGARGGGELQLGDDDHKTLYMCATTGLYSCRALVAG